jgi:hypothetical protein
MGQYCNPCVLSYIPIEQTVKCSHKRATPYQKVTVRLSDRTRKVRFQKTRKNRTVLILDCNTRYGNENGCMSRSVITVPFNSGQERCISHYYYPFGVLMYIYVYILLYLLRKTTRDSQQIRQKVKEKLSL